MNQQNIKVYLAISGALIVLLILIIVIPFSKKPPTTSNQPLITNSPFPTTVQTDTADSTDSTDSTVPADFTGVTDEELPPQVLNASLQKKDLRQKTPLDLSTFTINFDYSEDKFVVILKDSKGLSQKEFESWRATNYPGLSADQFLLK